MGKSFKYLTRLGTTIILNIKQTKMLEINSVNTY